MTLSKSLLLAVLITAVAVEPALAQEGWEQPALKLIEVLESGLVKIGAVLIGLGILGLGIWAAVTTRLDWQKFGYVLIGGVLVMAGPTMLKMLLTAVE